MPDGKFHIKGTLILKSSKEEKEEKGIKGKKGKKGKKEKEFSIKYKKPRKRKGTGTGVAITGQSFDQTKSPYTTQALMTAMSLRPQITYSLEQFKAPTIEQPAIEYKKFQDLPYIGYDEPVITTKREFFEKATPFLDKNIQQGIEEKKLQLEQGFKETKKGYDLAEEELKKKTQIMESEMEQMEASFHKKLADREQEAKTEKEKMRLELLDERAKSDAKLVMEGILGKIELKAEKEKAKQEMGQQSMRNRVETIRSMLESDLRSAISRIDKTYTLIPEEGKTKVDILRDKLIELEGLSKVAEEMGKKQKLKPGRKPKTMKEEETMRLAERVRQRSLARASMEQAEELNQKHMEQFTKEKGTNF